MREPAGPLAALALLLTACSSGVGADADLADLSEDTSSDGVDDTEDVADTDDTRPEVEVFVCTTDPECVPVIGGVDICERAACNTLTGLCVRTAKVNGTPCSDRNACTPNDTCQSARCVGFGQVDCDDGNPCTADRCEPREGCVHTPIDGFCEDDNLCLERKRCVDGRCSGTPIDCDDGDPCTTDRCDPDLGCVYRTLDPCPGSPG